MIENFWGGAEEKLTREQGVSESDSAFSFPERALMGKVKEGVPFQADEKDGIFALMVFVLGFCFARWVLFSWQGWGVTVFTWGYAGGVAWYFRKKGIHSPRAGWFWLTIVLLTGLSFSLWSNLGLEPWRSMLLFFSAVYWVILVAGLPQLGKTDNWFALDNLNGLLGIPFRNFGTQYQSLIFIFARQKTVGRKVFSVILGLFLTLLVGSLVLPLLIEADSGGFTQMTEGISTYLQGIRQEIFKLILDGILALPIAAYIFGLVAGSARGRDVNIFKKERVLHAVSFLQVLPMVTIYTLLSLLCGLYLVFIGSQLPYFFSAFSGVRPEGWLVYAEYARNGFFELCRIAAINLFVLTGANIFSKKSDEGGLPLKILNALLALLTLLLIATAFSKMTMYIGVYGLTMRRLLPCLLMILLAVISGGVIALQKWKFSIVRLAASLGVILLCTLCLLNPDGFVARYNGNRYLSGTLNDFDVTILYRSGPAGVDSAWQVYQKTKDPVLKEELQAYLIMQQEQAMSYRGKSGDNYEKAQAREKTRLFAD